MKIDRSIPPQPARPSAVADSSAATGARGEAAGPDRSSAPAASADAVSVRAGGLLEARKRDDDVRAERLKKLEREVQAGTYKPDPSAIADKMVERTSWLQALDDEIAALATSDEGGKK